MTIQGMKYTSDFEAKKAILDIGRRMYAKGFVASNDGNISCRVGPNTIWTTPTGVSKGFMTQDMLVKMDLDGKVLMGRLKPSSEIKMHLRVYQENPRLQAVTHAHPPMATCFAIAGQPLDAAILTEAILSLGTIPVARYATPGTQEVPDSIAPFVNHYNGVLLANHGALTWGDDIYQAFYRLESVEYYATILMYTGNIIGQQNHLSCEQVDRLLEIRKNMGITGGGVPPCMNGGQLTKVCESCAAAGEKPAAAGAELAGVSCGNCAAAGGKTAVNGVELADVSCGNCAAAGEKPALTGAERAASPCGSCAAAGEKPAVIGAERTASSCGSCAAAGETQTGPQAPLKGVTPLVRPGDSGKMSGGGLGAGAGLANAAAGPGSPSTGPGPEDKEALIAEIVRRVVGQLKA